MKSVPDETASDGISRPNFRCVWMEAGILSYQLCDRQFDCERCPLDAAMRMHFARPHEAETGKRQVSDILRDLRYSRNHCWMKTLSDGTTRVGLEPEFAAALATPKTIVLPAAGEKIRHGDRCVWVVLNEGTLPIRSPLSGSIVTANVRLSQQPSVLIESPYDDGWLFDTRARPDESVRSHFMTLAEARHCFTKDSLQYRASVQAALNEHAKQVGATLHDGGELLVDASAMLGGKRYLEILRSAFHC